MKKLFTILLATAALTFPKQSNSQITGKCPVYQFSYTKMLPATPVKDQAVTGTCWSFATTSFFESELIRMGKGEFDLSEMHTVRYNYINRVKDNYLKRGKGNLQEGSLSNMMFDVVNEHGIVPEEVYSGINYNSPTHNHTLLNEYVNAIAAVPVKNKEVTMEFDKLLNSLLDIYLGKVPQKFTYKGREYTPWSFYQSLGLNTNDYIFLTSFTHHPYYKEFLLEIPDNWNGGLYYNLPLDEFMQVIDNSIEKGFTVSWDGDMSEKSYSDKVGIAVLPTAEELASEEGSKLSFNRIYKEVNTDATSRQKGYETFVTTDDHLMHLIGTAKDKNGTTYYIVKNSWKPEINRFGGYNHLSREYVKAKTISVLVHKDALPAEILKKLR
ncbi:MAG: aminopeptidase [Bacteroidetes bacterium GWE2_39_28]|nr:MAG: aminopeptidase [Bacteroidetes bacterium GWE2_39_28]OFY13516.1 MAG: aminopeptidase [Bacteroidetes bacterium GWF2_39_10]OFZ06686.1 MAG: aminopeptidase [Bacteroidetes bacterium RIFOXYB2_FULL_39_7]OFZ11677.1 MAG: aminopeptidase [Bacteroidetes bacterium RIFOXYC2_FULL_39_11]HCT94850.1 aminopeptidase [Rikenellaceae bacterium]